MANRERSNSFNTIKYFILNATTYLTNTDDDEDDMDDDDDNDDMDDDEDDD